MKVEYKKLYAYLVGQVDDTLQMIAGHLIDGNSENESLVAVGNKLKNALLTAEDMYLDAEEDNE